KPERGDPPLREAPLYQRKKFHDVDIDRTSHLWRWRLARNNFVLSRAGLQEKPPVLNDRVHAWIAQRTGVINRRIEVGKREHLLRYVNNIHPLDVKAVKQRVRSNAAAITDKQHVF